MVARPGGERWLQLNEGLAIHSDYVPGSYLTGNYWDDFLVLPFSVRSAAPTRLAILGNAAFDLTQFDAERDYRTVRDSAALLDAVCLPQPGDPYFLSPDGVLMPTRKDQPPPDTRYFNRKK